MRRRSNSMQGLVWAALCGLSLAIHVAPAMAGEPAEPGAGFVDPKGIPERPTTSDIEPVYRAASIDTLATIRNRGVLRVGVAADAPMVMHDAKGQLVGFSIDIGRKLAQDLGTQVEFVETSWSQIIPDLLNRNSDVIISGLWITPARALVVNFTEPTSTEGIYLFAGNPLAAGMKTIEDFNRPDVRIAVYAGTIQAQIARDVFPKATLVETRDDENEIMLVVEGKAHAVLVPTFAPSVLAQSMPDKLILPFEAPLQTTVTAMAVRKGDPDFVNFLNSWIHFHRDDRWLIDRNRYWSESTDWLK